MSETEKFILEERPQTEVYTTNNGFIGIRQKLLSGETIILLTPEETAIIIKYLQKFVDDLQKN